ncbi:MAG TPA: aminoglycoside 6-adenylyltransferase [Candidatus Limnocylindria bacterium]|nr:aminoglycoside 6-adenylyltransferase [Candidatus Limnocylindria bacterium]
MGKQKEFISDFANWTKGQTDVLGAFLVGSYARNSEKDGSDIDFVIITSNTQSLLDNQDWVNQFGTVAKIQKENYGLVQSLRVFYQDGIEAEFGITTPEWIKLPIDPGTQKVLLDGYKILFEKDNLLFNLIKNLP